MRLTLLGVRGSTPAPGRDFVRYGGHTSCIAVTRDDEDLPDLVLDAGTGFRGLPGLLGGAAYDGSILLSHLHWDHVQGIPFCPSGDRDDSRVDVFLPAQEGLSGRDLLAQLMAPPAFPITPEGLRGDWSFHAVQPGMFETDGYVVTACEVTHKGGRTYAYRVEADGASLAYAPDHAPALGLDDATLRTMEGVDLLVQDAQFIDRERLIADDYGHATVRDAVELAQRVHARAVLLFHHGPGRKDDDLDRIADDIAADVTVLTAYEGMVLDVTSRTMSR
ncbi:MAG TPA: MBL fold metallo-hydrolase [Actinomycetes bacterium]|nr:MBL fold metallo-hydrolase [Actinomycetes bacterium]